METLTLEQARAARRSDQERFKDLFLQGVEDAIGRGLDWSGVLDAFRYLYGAQYAMSKFADAPMPPDELMTALEETLSKATEESDAESISLMLAVTLLNAIDYYHAEANGIVLTWTTMEDNKVRDAHEEAHGQQRPPGEPFSIGGFAMPYPGWPGAPIELWIKCRCFLLPATPGGFSAESEQMGQTVLEADQSGETMTQAWHGVLAPEGIRSGDGRMFKEGSLRSRDLPLPLTWQKISAEGHNQNVAVAKIQRIARVDGEIRAGGTYLDIPEAVEASSLVEEFGRYGVSIDADDIDQEAVSIELTDDGREAVTFSDGRICSACIVSIPAFAEAWVSNGEAPAGFFGEETEAEAASIEITEEMRDVPQDERDRRAKDGTALPDGSFPIGSCEDVSNAVKLWGHASDPAKAKAHIKKRARALGCTEQLPEDWSLEDRLENALTAGGGWCAPSEWMKRPEKIEKAFNISDDGHTWGYIAEWGVCHISYPGACTEAPPSQTDYALFLVGEILTDSGEKVQVGCLTVDTGHADGNLRARPAAAHYDNTGSQWAYVTVGEDDRGIWFSGMVKPGTSEETISMLRATGRISGDWREFNGNLELVAALTVNVEGFPKPQVAAMVASGEQISLVAAGMAEFAEAGEIKVKIGLGQDQIAEIAAAVVDENENRAKRRERMAALREKVNS